ncbi:phosphoenolpyruvate carboxykinase (ATP) [Maribellus maritimus]|uniref:hypothetical protein n=1 Tax=Maribellus maritimus TaxID=2870838 RepID=UPI001EEA41CF|nr:hypothetical protein [Maribellus maritimus]MCG6187534.1 hypothetical protein [Maribellus maritimus]
MTNVQFVKKKIGTSYLIWFKESNLYYQFEEPVWYVFERLVKNNTTREIASGFSEQYDLNFEESLTFVNDVQTKISELNQKDISLENNLPLLPNLNGFKYKAYVTHNYIIGDKPLRFSFETDWLENYVHPLIEHLKEETGEAYSNHFELFTFDDRVVFRHNGIVKGNWNDNESHLTKGKVFMTLVNTIYDKTDTDWLMTVHASALTNGKKTILFSAPPNSGKTTIAALLHTRGLKLISDDFVAVDRDSFNAYPFPSAMSVKEKSTDLLKPFFPLLEDKKLNYITEEKSVRYLPLENNTSMIFPVKEFVFVKYDKEVEFEWNKMDTLDAIKLLLEQTWVAPTFRNAEILFDRVEKSSFFQLTYSNNEKALQTIKQLFDYEQ